MRGILRLILLLLHLHTPVLTSTSTTVSARERPRHQGKKRVTTRQNIRGSGTAPILVLWASDPWLGCQLHQVGRTLGQAGTTRDKVRLALFSPCQVMAAPRYRDKSVNLRSQLAEKCLTKSANQQLRENVTLFPNLIAPKWQERFQEKNVALWKRSTASISRSRSARRFLNRNVSQ